MLMMMDPDSLAQTYWHLHIQDRTAWTQEIDLRPSNAAFLYQLYVCGNKKKLKKKKIQLGLTQSYGGH